MNGAEQAFANDNIAFMRLDVAQPENERIQQRYGVRGHPSVVILDANSQVTERFFGAVAADKLREAVTAVLEAK